MKLAFLLIILAFIFSSYSYFGLKISPNEIIPEYLSIETDFADSKAKVKNFLDT